MVGAVSFQKNGTPGARSQIAVEKLRPHAILSDSPCLRVSSYSDAYCATMRSSEKFSSTYWRRARGLISMFFTRLAISRTERHMYPEIPSRTISGTEPPRRAKTGVPHAIASTMTRPKGSFHLIGNSMAIEFPKSSFLAFSQSNVFDELPIDFRFDLCLEVFA